MNSNPAPPLTQPRSRKAALGFIFATVAIDMIGIGMIVPSLPGIMRRFYSDPSDISQAFGVFITVYAFMQFLASPLLGALSDLWGRRPILLISLAFAAMDHVLMAFAPTLTILFIGRVIAGLTGANITVAMSYIADISDDKKRAANFGLVGAAFGLGFVIGPALGGLASGLGDQAPFLISAGLNLVNFVFGFLVLPESLPKEKRRPFSSAKLDPFSSIIRSFRSPSLRIFFVAHFLFQLSGQTHPSIWTLYNQHRHGWSVKEVGFSLAAVGLLSAFAQGFLTRWMTPRLGEVRTLHLCGIGTTLAMLGFALATQSWMMIALLLISAPSWVLGPVLQALASKTVGPQDQGELQGALVGLSSLAMVLNPLIVTQLFAHYTKPMFPEWASGAPYFFAALVGLIGWFALRKIAHHPSVAEVPTSTA